MTRVRKQKADDQNDRLNAVTFRFVHGAGIQAEFGLGVRPNHIQALKMQLSMLWRRHTMRVMLEARRQRQKNEMAARREADEAAKQAALSAVAASTSNDTEPAKPPTPERET